MRESPVNIGGHQPRVEPYDRKVAPETAVGLSLSAWSGQDSLMRGDDVIPERFREDYDPEPADLPDEQEPRTEPPCGGSCPPVGCFRRNCWADYQPEEEA